MAAKSAILAAIATNLVSIASIKAVFAPATATGVKIIPDALIVFPSAVLLPGDSPLIVGNWERQTWTINGSIWVTDQPRGQRVQELTDLSDDVIDAFRVVNASATDAAVQSVVIRELGAITAQQWTRGDGAPWFLVLPFTLEAKVNRSVTYGPA